MATQTALALTEIGKPLTKITLPIPEPTEGEILIKITATGRKSAVVSLKLY
jgi:NADPH2:quinone reductase